MVKLVEFELEDGSSMYVEVDEKLPTADQPQVPGLVSSKKEEIKKTTYQTLQKSLSGIKAIGNSIIEKVKEFNEPADEVEVKLGLKMNADFQFVIAKGTGEVNYEITLKWNNTAKKALTNENNE